jgi:ubiquinone/menaquinone biosynthesis C-methylase UbiE
MPVQDAKLLSQQRYTQFGAGYVTSQTHAKGHDLERIAELSLAAKNMRALDIATGGGHTALKIAPLVGTMVASDLTPTMLVKAAAFIQEQGIHNAVFNASDAENLPYAATSFDLVTCRIAPHHFPNVSRFIRETARVLKPNGLFILQDHVLPEDHDTAAAVDGFERLRDPSHNQAFSRTAWLTMFDQARFQLEHAEEIIKRHNFLDWTERQGNDPEIQAKLIQFVKNAPGPVRDWLAPKDWDTPQASFINHHILIVARKPQ